MGMDQTTPFDTAALERLGVPRKHFDAGEKVFLENDTGDVMYLLRSGRVDILHYGAVLENVRAGGIVGEIALIDGSDRSAAAIATEPTDVFAIDRQTFLALIREDPEFALQVMAVLAGRIRRMNRQI